jgi:putative nucleotidyltransferase with HDIG domain
LSVLQSTHTATRGERFRQRGWRRVSQFTHAFAVRARPDARIDAELRLLLADERQWQLVARLAPFDRAHQLRVHALLLERGHTDPDLLRAALLHDVGKADERGRVGWPARVALVALRAAAPQLLERLSIVRWPGPLGSVYLARHHAAFGARLAAGAGASQRCCELIARHEGPAGADDALAALLAADAQAVT